MNIIYIIAITNNKGCNLLCMTHSEHCHYLDHTCHEYANYKDQEHFILSGTPFRGDGEKLTRRSQTPTVIYMAEMYWRLGSKYDVFSYRGRTHMRRCPEAWFRERRGTQITTLDSKRFHYPY